MSEPITYLGMPGYGNHTDHAGRSLWRARRNMDPVIVECRSGSLLGANFNQLWCSALNLAHQGHEVAYFAMLHSDIGAQDYWLDALIEELEAQQLDVLGVAVPIKDRRGMTSLALHKDGDPWMPFARLSMNEVYQLPETFTSEDVGHPLLLNTGCWVARFNLDWAKMVHFEINDRIVFNRACNRYQAQTEPEDWHFSRQLHEIGAPGSPTDGLRPLRIAATRKIAVRHRGEMDFDNTHAWGTQLYDSEAVACSPLPNFFPAEIDGWLTPQEGAALAELARGKRVLEIGSYCGRSTVCLARTAASVDAVDYFDGRGTPAPRDTLAEFGRNLARYGVGDKVTTRHPDEPLTGEYDLAFIDGAHDYEAVIADAMKALGVLAHGGVLAFHDYEPVHPGVMQAVNEMCVAGGALVQQVESLAIVKPAQSFQEV